MASRYKVGDRVIVRKIVFVVGGAWDIEPTLGTIIDGPDASFRDYKVKLVNMPKGFGYNEGYTSASWMRKVS